MRKLEQLGLGVHADTKPAGAFNISKARAQVQDGYDSVAQRVRETAEQSAALSTAKLTHATSNSGGIEVQAIALRMQGKTYVEIGALLDVSAAWARKLVEAGSKLLVDEDADIQLRMHQSRIEGLICAWYGLATGETERPLEPTGTMLGVVDLPAQGTDRKSAAVVTIQLLALQQRLAPWADKLPLRGAKDKGEDEFYREAHAILMRADQRGGQWAPESSPGVPPPAPEGAPDVP